jgi:hypothetical protein
LYFYTNKSIEEKNELVCLAPFYDTVDSVRKILTEGHKAIDVKKYEKNENSLIIIDSFEKYFDNSTGRGFDKESVLKDNRRIVENADELNKNGVSILGDVGAFIFKNQIQSLIDYESSLPAQFDINLKGICLYHHKDFDRLSSDQKEKIIKHHKIAINLI